MSNQVPVISNNLGLTSIGDENQYVRFEVESDATGLALDLDIIIYEALDFDVVTLVD